jgi:long-chain acyl-CoA synthetase
LRAMFSNSYTVEISDPAETPMGERTARRNKISQHGLTETPHPAIRTIYDLVQFNASRWGDNSCFGTRKVIKVHIENGPSNGSSPPTSAKLQMFWELGPFEYRTYKQVAAEGMDIGSAMRKLGMEKGDMVAIYAETSYFPVYPR